MRPRSVVAICGLLFGLCLADSNVTNKGTTQLILQGDFKPPQVFENVNLVRNTNLEKGYVRETVNVVITNVDQKAQSEYYLPFAYDVLSKVGGIEVRDKKNPERGKLDVEAAALAPAFAQDGTLAP